MSTAVAESIAFVDLAAQRRRLGGRIEQAIARVLDHGQFIMGPEVGQLEQRLTDFSGAGHAITCANGTDALSLVLSAEGIGPGDAVFVPAFTFVAPAEVVPPTGATVILVDVLRDTFNMDPSSLEAAIGWAKDRGLKPRMVIAVDLFGQAADYPAITTIARSHDMVVVADAAQSFGAKLGDARVGTLADWTTTSFFPAKPLGCYGDGGAVFTDNASRAELVRSLCAHGRGGHKYEAARVGVNSRLDTIQAAILIEKLAIFPDEIAAREGVARRYSETLGNNVTTPRMILGAASVWAQYTIVVERRDAVADACRRAGIPTAIYYPRPINRQQGYAALPTAPQGVPVSEWLSQHVISLPMHPYLDESTQDMIVATIRGAAQGA